MSTSDRDRSSSSPDELAREARGGGGSDAALPRRRGPAEPPTIEPSESNAFAKAVAGKGPIGPAGRRARFVLGVTLSLVLAACLTIAFFLLCGLIVRGVRRGDYVALGAALAVIALTFVMARGRRKPPAKL